MQLLETTKLPQSFQPMEIQQNEIFSFPKVYNVDTPSRDIICLQQLMIRNGDKIISDLKKQGSLMFTDFDIKSPNQAVALLKHLGFVDFGCCENKLKIVVGTKQKEMLNTQPLTMFACQSSSDVEHANIHNQFCQTTQCPQFVALYCFRPAAKGGNISLINWKQFSEVVNYKHPDFLKNIKQKGIAEITILSEHSNENGWKNSFKVANKEEAQIAFKQKNYEFEWLDNQSNDCRLRKIKKGPQLYNILNQIISLYKTCQYNKCDLQDILTFGDGQKIPRQILTDICQIAQKYIAEVQMKVGNLIIMDYSIMKYIHCPYEGPEQLRRMYVSFMKLQVNKQKCTQLYQILNTGYKLPLIGFGTWKIKKEEAEQVVYNAIKCGYRLIDCAPVYQNEVQVGKGIKKAIDQKLVSREELFVTSKLWNTNHRPQYVRPACEKTLKDLGLEYLDLLLMHFPVSLKFVSLNQQKYPEWVHDTESQRPYMLEDRVPVTETWKAMEDLVAANLVRNIGVSNFTVALLRQLIFTCQIKPAVHQTQIHPELNEKKLIRYAREEGIQMTSYSSFGASSYFEIGFAKKDEKPIYENDKIKQIAKKHDRTPHQVVLRWAIQQGLAVIPKSVKSERMKENSDITEFALDKQDMEEIQKLHRGRRYNDPGDFCEGFGTFYPLHE